MFIWNFVADTVLEQILDWIYSQMIGFLGNFLAAMGNMGADLFDMAWVKSILARRNAASACGAAESLAKQDGNFLVFGIYEEVAAETERLNDRIGSANRTGMRGQKTGQVQAVTWERIKKAQLSLDPFSTGCPTKKAPGLSLMGIWFWPEF